MKDASKAEVAKFEAELAKRPPDIQWGLGRGRGGWLVQIPLFVDDPYPDAPHNGQKTACKRGHEYTPENTLETVDGHRQCRTCKNENRTAPKQTTEKQRLRKNELERDRKRRRREAAALMLAGRTRL